jgi:hypothetical protein
MPAMYVDLDEWLKVTSSLIVVAHAVSLTIPTQHPDQACELVAHRA